jgi:hypothetical protein
VDAPLSRRLARLLDDPDADVADGALCVLVLSLGATRHAFDPVLAFVRGRADEDRRARAVALLHLADTTQLPLLEAALKAERSEKVRQQLRAVIDSVKTGNLFVAP